MSKKISIAIDAMGGDNSPDKTIQGIKIFLERNANFKDFILNIFGKEEIILEKLNKYNINSDFINVIHSSTVVSDEEPTAQADKISKNIGKWKGLQHELEGKCDVR